MRASTLGGILGAILAGAGCGGSIIVGGADGAADGAEIEDAAGVSDGGVPAGDAGLPDGSAPAGDAGLGDGGTQDAGGHGDGGAVDAGAVDAGSADAGGADAGAPPCAVVLVEPEAFSLNAWWRVCPGAGCEDDRSAEASGGAHLITLENTTTGEPQGGLTSTVELPEAGPYAVWTRSVRGGAQRLWQVAVAGVDLSPSGGATGWEHVGFVDRPAGPAELTIHDASPDAWWAYPDVIVLTTDPAFDPTTCAAGGVDALPCEGWCSGVADADADGYVVGVDCDDLNAAVHPGAVDLCGDGVDSDCAGGDPTCPVCAEGPVIPEGCTCGGSRVTSGFCCAGSPQTTACSAGGFAVTALQGSPVHGASVVVQGSGFGSHPDLHPDAGRIIRMWETFESGDFSSNPYGSWGIFGADALEILRDAPTARPAAANRYTFRRNSVGLGGLEFASQDHGGYFISHWIRLSDAFDICGFNTKQWKGTRLWSANSTVNVYWAFGCSDGFHVAVENTSPTVLRHYAQFQDLPEPPARLAGWHRWDMYVQKATAPTATDGILQIYVDQQLVYDFDRDTGIHYGGAGFENEGADFAKRLSVGSYFSGASDQTWLDYDDVYISHTRARVELCDAADLVSASHCEIQEPLAWSDGSITLRFNRGTFSVGARAWLLVVNDGGQASQALPIAVAGP